jgi:hypothetical protein
MEHQPYELFAVGCDGDPRRLRPDGRYLDPLHVPWGRARRGEQADRLSPESLIPASSALRGTSWSTTAGHAPSVGICFSNPRSALDAVGTLVPPPEWVWQRDPVAQTAVDGEGDIWVLTQTPVFNIAFAEIPAARLHAAFR